MLKKVLNQDLIDSIHNEPLALGQDKEYLNKIHVSNNVMGAIKDALYSKLSNEDMNILILLRNRRVEQKIALDLISENILKKEVEVKGKRDSINNILFKKGFIPKSAILHYISTLSALDPVENI